MDKTRGDGGGFAYNEVFSLCNMPRFSAMFPNIDKHAPNSPKSDRWNLWYHSDNKHAGRPRDDRGGKGRAMTDIMTTDKINQDTGVATCMLRPAFRRLATDMYSLGPFGPVRTSLWAVAEVSGRNEGKSATLFALGIKGCGRRLFCRMGRDEVLARDLYRRLVAGRMSPTAIREILACELSEEE